jgi:hypothetical protein
MTKEKRPNILFLMKTKCRKNKMELVRVKLGFEGLFAVDPIGRSGGLALLWKEVDILEIQNFSKQHINAIVKHLETGKGWKLTGFYGHSDWTKRCESWEFLRHLKIFSPLSKEKKKKNLSIAVVMCR